MKTEVEIKEVNKPTEKMVPFDEIPLGNYGIDNSGVVWLSIECGGVRYGVDISGEHTHPQSLNGWMNVYPIKKLTIGYQK